MSKNVAAGLVTLGVICAIGPIVGAITTPPEDPAKRAAADAQAAADAKIVAEEARAKAVWGKRFGEVKGACMGGEDAIYLPTKVYMAMDKACDLEAHQVVSMELDPERKPPANWMDGKPTPPVPTSAADDLVDPTESDILAQAENEMNQAWEAVYPRLDGAAQATLAADQEVWIRKKDGSCFEGRRVHVNCRVDLIAARRNYLAELSERLG